MKTKTYKAPQCEAVLLDQEIGIMAASQYTTGGGGEFGAEDIIINGNY